MCRYKVRPHHALCMTFFEGKGYSEEFVTHMTKLLFTIQETDQIEIVMGTDEVCSHCPNNREFFCVTQEKVERYDKRVSECCGFVGGQQLSFGEFMSAVDQEVLKKDKLVTICGDCEWYKYCKNREK